MYRLRDILLLCILFLAVVGCKEEPKSYVKIDVDPETTPTVISRDVKTLISDSGITQYRITAKLWTIYQEAEKPFWKFPEGLFLEKFDSLFNVEASIKADSATYFKADQLWRLDGHVTILNVNNERILTQQIFWDQRNQEVRSDSFIHIERANRILEGYGFRSNERMTIYELERPMGIFPVEEFRGKNRDSLPADTVKPHKK